MLIRRGHTLLELLVALTLAAMVLAVAVAVATAQGRVQRRLRAGISGSAVRRDGTDVVPLLLDGLSAAMGDIPTGGARDSTLDFREGVFSGVACATAGGELRLFGVGDGGLESASSSSTALDPQPSDSVWLLDGSDSTTAWTPYLVNGVRASSGSCSAGDSTAAPAAPADPTLTVTIAPAPRRGVLLAARTTRRARLSVYRASDGEWYLGLREWSQALGGLESVQPVVGPLAKPAPASRAFVYRDAAGASLGPAAAAAPGQVATIEVSVRPAHDPIDSAVARAGVTADRAVVALHP